MSCIDAIDLSEFVPGAITLICFISIIILVIFLASLSDLIPNPDERAILKPGLRNELDLNKRSDLVFVPIEARLGFIYDRLNTAGTIPIGMGTTVPSIACHFIDGRMYYGIMSLGDVPSNATTVKRKVNWVFRTRAMTDYAITSGGQPLTFDIRGNITIHRA